MVKQPTVAICFLSLHYPLFLQLTLQAIKLFLFCSPLAKKFHCLHYYTTHTCIQIKHKRDRLAI